MRKIKSGIQRLWRVALQVFFPYSIIIDKYSIIERMSMSFSRGALSKATTTINELNPTTWEFSAFSQNGEDGIIDFLTQRVKNPNRYFVEIGSSDGLENNSSYLAFSRKYSGVMIEGDRLKSNHAKKYLERFNWGVKYINCFVDRENTADLMKKESLYSDPDFFSLDIDGIDYYVMDTLLASGFRPKVICVEYNSSFGPEREITIKYRSDFNYSLAHGSRFYYGVSINGWKKLFKKFNYDFITVDANGVNAFFVDLKQMSDDFPVGIKSKDFEENFALRARYKNRWKEQFELIKDMPYYEI